MQMRRSLIVLLAVTPSLLFAQRGGGGGGSGGGSSIGTDPKRGTGKQADYGKVLGDSKVGMKLTPGDVEEMNPIALLLDKRRDLKLTDDQQKALRARNDKLKEENKVHLHALDSLRGAMRPRKDLDDQVDAARIMMTRDEVAGVVKVIRGNYDTAAAEVLPLLDATQQPKAGEFLAKQKKDAEETLGDKLGGGGRRN